MVPKSADGGTLENEGEGGSDREQSDIKTNGNDPSMESSARKQAPVEEENPNFVDEDRSE